MILVKNVKIFHFLVLWEKSLEKMCGDVLDRKQASPDYKNISVV